MGIQSSINSMINTVTGGVAIAKGFQEKKAKQAQQQQKAQVKSIQAQAKQIAQQSASNEIEAKKSQKLDIDKMQTSLGVTVGELPENMRKQIYKEYNR